MAGRKKQPAPPVFVFDAFARAKKMLEHEMGQAVDGKKIEARDMAAPLKRAHTMATKQMMDSRLDHTLQNSNDITTYGDVLGETGRDILDFYSIPAVGFLLRTLVGSFHIHFSLLSSALCSDWD